MCVTAGEPLTCKNMQVTNTGNIRLGSILPHASAGTVACDTALLAVDASIMCSLTVTASQDHFEAGMMSSTIRVTAVQVNSAGTEVAGNYTATVQLKQAPAAVVSVATGVSTANSAGESCLVYWLPRTPAASTLCCKWYNSSLVHTITQPTGYCTPHFIVCALALSLRVRCSKQRCTVLQQYASGSVLMKAGTLHYVLRPLSSTPAAAAFSYMMHSRLETRVT